MSRPKGFRRCQRHVLRANEEVLQGSLLAWEFPLDSLVNSALTIKQYRSSEMARHETQLLILLYASLYDASIDFFVEMVPMHGQTSVANPEDKPAAIRIVAKLDEHEWRALADTMDVYVRRAKDYRSTCLKIARASIEDEPRQAKKRRIEPQQQQQQQEDVIADEDTDMVENDLILTLERGIKSKEIFNSIVTPFAFMDYHCLALALGQHMGTIVRYSGDQKPLAVDPSDAMHINQWLGKKAWKQQFKNHLYYAPQYRPSEDDDTYTFHEPGNVTVIRPAENMDNWLSFRENGLFYLVSPLAIRHAEENNMPLSEVLEIYSFPLVYVHISGHSSQLADLKFRAKTLVEHAVTEDLFERLDLIHRMVGTAINEERGAFHSVFSETINYAAANYNDDKPVLPIQLYDNLSPMGSMIAELSDVLYEMGEGYIPYIIQNWLVIFRVPDANLNDRIFIILYGEHGVGKTRVLLRATSLMCPTTTWFVMSISPCVMTIPNSPWCYRLQVCDELIKPLKQSANDGTAARGDDSSDQYKTAMSNGRVNKDVLVFNEMPNGRKERELEHLDHALPLSAIMSSNEGHINRMEKASRDRCDVYNVVACNRKGARQPKDLVINDKYIQFIHEQQYEPIYNTYRRMTALPYKLHACTTHLGLCGDPDAEIMDYMNKTFQAVSGHGFGPSGHRGGPRDVNNIKKRATTYMAARVACYLERFNVLKWIGNGQDTPGKRIYFFMLHNFLSVEDVIYAVTSTPASSHFDLPESNLILLRILKESFLQKDDVTHRPKIDETGKYYLVKGLVNQSSGRKWNIDDKAIDAVSPTKSTISILRQLEGWSCGVYGMAVKRVDGGIVALNRAILDHIVCEGEARFVSTLYQRFHPSTAAQPMLLSSDNALLLGRRRRQHRDFVECPRMGSQYGFHWEGDAAIEDDKGWPSDTNSNTLCYIRALLENNVTFHQPIISLNERNVAVDPIYLRDPDQDESYEVDLERGELNEILALNRRALETCFFSSQPDASGSHDEIAVFLGKFLPPGKSVLGSRAGPDDVHLRIISPSTDRTLHMPNGMPARFRNDRYVPEERRIVPELVPGLIPNHKEWIDIDLSEDTNLDDTLARLQHKRLFPGVAFQEEFLPSNIQRVIEHHYPSRGLYTDASHH